VVNKIFRSNIQPTRTVINGHIPVASVFYSQVEYIQLKHTNTKIQEQFFNITPKSHTFKLKLPTSQHFQISNTTFTAEMKVNQLPILQNCATTGHTLQGSGVKTVFVHKWSKVTNWNYVMLSRVQNMSVLYAK
jgi:hypothetical protein